MITTSFNARKVWFSWEMMICVLFSLDHSPSRIASRASKVFSTSISVKNPTVPILIPKIGISLVNWFWVLRRVPSPPRMIAISVLSSFNSFA